MPAYSFRPRDLKRTNSKLAMLLAGQEPTTFLDNLSEIQGLLKVQKLVLRQVTRADNDPSWVYRSVMELQRLPDLSRT